VRPKIGLMGIAAWLVLGAVAGYLAGEVVRSDPGLGAVGHVLLGIVGALVAGFLVDALTGTNPSTGVDIRSIVAAAIGAIVAVPVWDAAMEPVARDRPTPRPPSPRTGRRPV
jgi:uncharacterized membrane protein YeaQ/YmgE (transglycosylase-associated protein family)